MRCVSITQQENSLENSQAYNTNLNQPKIKPAKTCEFHKLSFVFSVKDTGKLSCSDPINHVKNCAYETCSCSLDLVEKFAVLAHKHDLEKHHRREFLYGTAKERVCNYHKVWGVFLLQLQKCRKFVRLRMKIFPTLFPQTKSISESSYGSPA